MQNMQDEAWAELDRQSNTAATTAAEPEQSENATISDSTPPTAAEESGHPNRAGRKCRLMAGPARLPRDTRATEAPAPATASHPGSAADGWEWCIANAMQAQPLQVDVVAAACHHGGLPRPGMAVARTLLNGCYWGVILEQMQNNSYVPATDATDAMKKL
jgi:hypothetical protein